MKEVEDAETKEEVKATNNQVPVKTADCTKKIKNKKEVSQCPVCSKSYKHLLLHIDKCQFLQEKHR